MIIDRTAAVAPLRYADPGLRKWMGRYLAATDSDDLLASWLQFLEGHYLQKAYQRLSAHQDRVKRELADARGRAAATSSWGGYGPAPTAEPADCTSAFIALIKALEAEAMAADRAVTTCVDVWDELSNKFGIYPHRFRRDNPSGKPAPVEEVAALLPQLSAAERRLRQLLADHRSDVYEIALAEELRISHLKSEASVSVEGQYLRSTYEAIHGHKEWVTLELAEAVRRRDAPFVPGTHGWLPQAVREACAGATRQWALFLFDEVHKAEAALDECVDIWTEMSEDFGLTPDRAPSQSRRSDGPAKMKALASLSYQLAEARTRIEQALSTCRHQIHAIALRENRRYDYLDSGQSISQDEILAMHHRQFEVLATNLMERDGFDLIRTRGGSGDLGADVIAVGPDGVRIVVQCKHSSKRSTKVGTPVLQRLNGTAGPVHRADVAIVLTNASFSAPAQQFAVAHGIRLLNGYELSRWATWGEPLSEILDLSRSGAVGRPLASAAG